MKNFRMYRGSHPNARFMCVATSLALVLFVSLPVIAHDMEDPDGGLNKGIFNVFVVLNTILIVFAQSLATARAFEISFKKIFFWMAPACVISILIPGFLSDIEAYEKISAVLILMKPIVELPFIYFLMPMPRHILQAFKVSMINLVFSVIITIGLVPVTLPLSDTIYLFCPFCW